MIYSNRIPSSHLKDLKDRADLPDGEVHTIHNRLPSAFFKKAEPQKPKWEEDFYWDYPEGLDEDQTERSGTD